MSFFSCSDLLASVFHFSLSFFSAMEFDCNETVVALSCAAVGLHDNRRRLPREACSFFIPSPVRLSLTTLKLWFLRLVKESSATDSGFQVKRVVFHPLMSGLSLPALKPYLLRTSEVFRTLTLRKFVFRCLLCCFCFVFATVLLRRAK